MPVGIPTLGKNNFPNSLVWLSTAHFISLPFCLSQAMSPPGLIHVSLNVFLLDDPLFQALTVQLLLYITGQFIPP